VRLVASGVRKKVAFSKEKRFIHPGRMRLLTHDENGFEAYGVTG